VKNLLSLTAVGVLAVLGVACLWQGQSLVYLGEAEEGQMVAGLFRQCGPATATCVLCTRLTSCTLVAGGCLEAGGIDGCINTLTRLICQGSWNPYGSCFNNTGPNACGGYNSYTRCVITRSFGKITSCSLPAPNVCTPWVMTSQCQDCT